MQEHRLAQGLALIDHERLVTDLLKHTFEAEDFNVAVIAVIDEAWRQIDDLGDAVVLINATMPGAILFLGRFGHTHSPILLTSSDEHVALAETIGVEHIDRRQSLAELIDAIRQHLKGEAPKVNGGDHVLVVDDDELVRKTLMNFLTSSGYRVSQAATGRDALSMVDSDSSISAILLDLNMPEFGGLDTLAELRKRKRTESVIMLSGISDQEIAHRALAYGAFDYILKPPDFNALESVISACIGHSEYRRQHLW